MTINILFTCAGRRNYLINYFKKALNNRGQIFAVDMSRSAPAMVDADVAIEVPSIYDPLYIPTLKSIIKKHSITLLIPLNDLELPILSKHKLELENLGVKVIVSSSKAIDIAFDKLKTFDFLKEIGLKTPQTYTDFERAKSHLQTGQLQFPVVVKPRWGSASIGIDFPEDLEELEMAFKLQHLKLKRSILREASQQDLANAILIQEKIEGAEFGMDILNDFEGNHIGSYARKKLSMRSGETDKAISIIDQRFEDIGKTIASHLKHIGNLDCDIFEYKNTLYVLELNPRFGGGYPFSHEAGINTAAIYIEWLTKGENWKDFITYKSGLAFSKYDRLMAIPT